MQVTTISNHLCVSKKKQTEPLAALLERLDPGAAALLAASVGELSGAVLWNKGSWSTELDYCVLR